MRKKNVSVTNNYIFTPTKIEKILFPTRFFALAAIGVILGSILYFLINGEKVRALPFILNLPMPKLSRSSSTGWNVTIFGSVSKILKDIKRILPFATIGFCTGILSYILFSCIQLVRIFRQRQNRIIRKLCDLTKATLKDWHQTDPYPIAFIREEVLEQVEEKPFNITIDTPVNHWFMRLVWSGRITSELSPSVPDIDSGLAARDIAITLWPLVERKVSGDVRVQTCNTMFSGKNYSCWRFLGKSQALPIPLVTVTETS